MRKLLIGFIFLSAAWASDIRTDEVRGAHFLTTAGRLTEVTALGVITQSAFLSSAVVLGAPALVTVNALLRTSAANTVGEVSTTATIRESAAGLLEADSFTLGNWAGFQAGTLRARSIAAPAAPVVTPTCVPGVCNLTWSYVIAARLGDGTTTEAGPVGSTALQNGTIDANSYNTITWAAVAGATSYDVRRTVSAGIPASLGIIGTVTAPLLVDNGLAGDGSPSPTVNATGRVTVGTGGIMFAADGVGDIGAAWANRPGYIYASVNITAQDAFYGSRFIISGIGSTLTAGANGYWKLSDFVGTDFNCLQFGGVTNAYGALCRDGAGLKVRVASNDAWADLKFKRTTHMNGVEGGCATAADLVVDAVLNTKVTSATYTFVAADVGGSVEVISGAGWTPGDYSILSVAAGAATLDASPAPVGTAAGTFTVNRGMKVFVRGILGVAADTYRICNASILGVLSWQNLIGP